MRNMNRIKLFKGRLPQLVAVFAATVSAISDGMSYGWASPVIPILQSPNTPVVIEEKDIVWLESIYMIGGIAGLPMTIYIVDKFGRKNSILFAALMNLVHWIILSVSRNIWMLYAARWITGIAGDVAFVAGPMYIAEIADQHIRGFLASIIYIMMLIGILVVYSVAPFVSIPISSAVGASFLVIQLITLPMMPESPYYLLLKHKEEKAKKALQFFRGTDEIDKELNDIKTAVTRQSQEKGTIKDLVMIDSNRKAILIMTVLNAAQHFSSISVILMNLHSIINDAAAIISANTAAIIFACIMLASAMTASAFIDRLGRKVLLTTSSLLTGLSLGVLASYFAVKNAGHDVSNYNWVPIAAVMVYAVAFKFGLGLIPIVLTAELFPTNVKAMGMTISDAMYVIFACISIYLYKYLEENFGKHVPFFMFSASCIITALFAIFYIPETKGKTLEEIQYLLKGKAYRRNSATSGVSRSNPNLTMTNTTNTTTKSTTLNDLSSSETDTSKEGSLKELNTKV